MFKKFILSLFVLLLTACQTLAPPTEPVSPLQKVLDKHLNQWRHATITNYTYDFQRSCFCVREYTKPVRLRVESNKVVDARFKGTNEPLPKRLKGNRQTINDLFKTIQDAIDRNAYRIDVQYNEQYGFPSLISVDYHQQMADEELYLKASNFQPF